MNSLSDQTNVLVLEDNPEDAILIRFAFKRTGCDAFVCRNSSEAAAYFLGSGMYADRGLYPLPDIFITDLRLGEESGVRFMAWLRSTKQFQDIPVIVLSGAATPEDIRAVQRLRAARIIIKPSSHIELHDILVELSRDFCPSLKKENSPEPRAFADSDLVLA